MNGDPVKRPHTSTVTGYRQFRRARTWAFTRILAPGFAELGKGSTIAPPCAVGRSERIRIGSNVVIGPGCILRIVGNTTAGTTVIHIEDGVSIVGTCAISAVESVIIGAGALFARNIYIADHSHAYDDPSRFIKDQGTRDVAPVRIGRGAWLGENVVVLPGVTIGDGAVVGANSVVRRDIPPYSVAAGSPARVLRTWAPGG